MNNIAPKLQKCWTHKIAFKIISKMLKQPNFFHSQPSILPKEAMKHLQNVTFLAGPSVRQLLTHIREITK